MSDPDRPRGEPTLPYVDDTDAVNVVKIGRYQLLEMVGAGGMGMVWGAWDPELERRVALKLIRSASSDGRARMLREGQVLARLSHPNIVPIFDVGEMGDQVYLVMEWIRGTTLGAYGSKATELSALLRTYRQAGEGLAAAHDAGVIHRDFKPDNAICGEDGRVRVLDFGIAQEASVGGAIRSAGTPKYMSPEHVRGELATAASDQFAFCVALREALETTLGVPSWVDAILTRGTDPDPARRFESMHALLRALDRTPARRWRRIAFGVVAASAALGAFAIGRARSDGAEAVEPCSGGASEIAADWGPAARARMVAHLRPLGPISAGDIERLATELDGYAVNWVTEQRSACLAHERKLLTPPLYAERLGCLTRLRSQLAATGELMSTVDADGLAPALLAAHALPDAHGCADTSGLVAPPPATVAEAVRETVPRVERALVRAAAQRSDAIDAAREATAAARATGYAPLIARALLVEGRAATVNSSDARTTFAEAMSLALRASDDTTAVEAYARWVFELARNGETAIDGWTMMVEIAARSGRAGRFARALMFNNRAVAKTVAEDKTGARELLMQAQAIAGNAPELELVAIDKNLAGLESDPAACAQRLGVARARLQAALGSTHPDVLLTRVPLALLASDHVAARVELEQVCRELERWHHAGSFAACAFELAWLADEDGDRTAASTWMAYATSGHAGAEKAAIAAAYLAVAKNTGDLSVHLAALERLVADPHPTWWSRLDAADALVVLAMVDPKGWKRVVPMIESVDQPFYARRRARAQAMARADSR